MGNPRGLDPSVAVPAGRDDKAPNDAGFAFDGVYQDLCTGVLTDCQGDYPAP
jgi:hypothetical protein